MIADEMADVLAPTKLSFGVRGGSEAAVHAVRHFLTDKSLVLVKFDFANAFYSI